MEEKIKELIIDLDFLKIREEEHVEQLSLFNNTWTANSTAYTNGELFIIGIVLKRLKAILESEE